MKLLKTNKITGFRLGEENETKYYKAIIIKYIFIDPRCEFVRDSLLYIDENLVDEISTITIIDSIYKWLADESYYKITLNVIKEQEQLYISFQYIG